MIIKDNIDFWSKIKIGVMVKKDGRLSIKRGYSLLLNVVPGVTYEDLLEKAVEKHSCFIKMLSKATIRLGREGCKRIKLARNFFNL